jgi:ATP-dependent DNA helicase HFM1/MER3
VEREIRARQARLRLGKKCEQRPRLRLRPLRRKGAMASARDTGAFVPTHPSATRLRHITEVPPHLREAFQAVFAPAFSTFNAMQSQVVDKMVTQHESVVVSAPTGTGKTAVFEMAVLSLFAGYDGQGKGHKAVYLAPSKFLVMQKAQEWAAKFGEKLRIVEVTGDTSINNSEMAASDIILSTPEKWDSVSRKWKDAENFVFSIKLLMVRGSVVWCVEFC